MRRRLAVATVTALAITGLAACGSDDEPAEEDGGTTAAAGSTLSTDPIEGLTVKGAVGQRAAVSVDGLDVDDVQTSLLVEGDGDAVPADGTVLLRSLFAVGGTGKSLSSSFGEKGSPQSVVVDQTQDFIKNALVGTPVGSRVAIALPATDYFQGSPTEGSGITDKDDLVIVLDVVDLADPPLEGPEGTEVEPPEDAPTVVEEDGEVTGLDFSQAPAKAPTELQVIPLVEGEGPKLTASSQIVADYLGVVWGAEKPFDKSYGGDPLDMPLSGLVKGWGEGLTGVAVGSRVLLVIPPELGYGDEAQGDIPANSTLVFVVDVLGARS